MSQVFTPTMSPDYVRYIEEFVIFVVLFCDMDAKMLYVPEETVHETIIEIF